MKHLYGELQKTAGEQAGKRKKEVQPRSTLIIYGLSNGTKHKCLAVLVCVVLCQKQTEYMAMFCEHFTVDFRFGAECSKGISLEL